MHVLVYLNILNMLTFNLLPVDLYGVTISKILQFYPHIVLLNIQASEKIKHSELKDVNTVL